MIYLLFSSWLLFSNNCLDSKNTEKIAEAAVNKDFHKYLKVTHQMPLGIYEKFDLSNYPILLNISKAMPPVIAAKPNKNNKIRAIGLIVNGAYYASRCAIVHNYFKKELTIAQLINSYKEAVQNKSPYLRKAYLAYALFRTGIWLAGINQKEGPATRMQAFLNRVKTSKSFNILKGVIFAENPEGLRYIIKSPQELKKLRAKKIIIVSATGSHIKILAWPPNKDYLNYYPAILVQNKIKSLVKSESHSHKTFPSAGTHFPPVDKTRNILFPVHSSKPF
ncbi:MAG: hypothetical protein ACQES9_06145 [Myxococcota bacterium]